jgi:1-acyl-sn-glycerol-3-phosphate acyltransferase
MVRPPPRPVRRILIPIDIVALVVLMGVCTIGVIVGLVGAPLSPRRRLLRITSFSLAYCLMELMVLIAAGCLSIHHVVWRLVRTDVEERWLSAHHRLLATALGLVLGAARVCFRFEAVVSDASIDQTLHDAAPVLVLARHGGPGDSFVLVHLLLTRYRRRLKIVLKDALQFDPAVDILLNRLGCCFVRSASGSGDSQGALLGEMARTLGPRGALLLFPEGANWTPRRRRRAIQHLREAREDKAASAASLMANVLPPRPGGVLACLDVRPDLRVVMVAHAGIDQVVHAAQAWDQLPLTTPMTIRIWPTVTAPLEPQARGQWLTTEWAIVDEWIGGYHSGVLDQSQR